MNKVKSMLCAATLCVSMEASAVLIDFQGLAAGTEVTNQYPEATFSSAGAQLLITNQPIYVGTGGLFICTGLGGGIDCARDFVVVFTSPVSNVSFDSVGDDVGVGGSRGKVDVFVSGVLAATLDIIGDGTIFDTDPVDLTAFSNVTGIRIHDVIDAGGLGFDNFRFDVGTAPEPGTLALLGIALAGLGFSRRKQ